MIVYIHPKCTTCKKALKWNELNDVTFEQKDIRETPPTAKELYFFILSLPFLFVNFFFKTECSFPIIQHKWTFDEHAIPSEQL